tara:strand:- start:10 stop:783 length:774 start_codon:yes stop_codon:yes gene_type:complete
MKRIIYSVYTSVIQEHKSSTDYKKTQFKKYKKQLEKSQKDYASLCKADYILEETSETNYDNIQFDKIKKLDYYSQYYDEILYLDFDVVPITKVNIFDYFDFNNICSYALDRTPDSQVMRWAIEADGFDGMNMYIKTCAKNAMLLLDGINGSNNIINTGVIGGNKESIAKLDFSNNIDKMICTLEEARNDTLYPIEINRIWKPNNEVFVTYLIERYSLPYTNIGIQWNFIIDKLCPKPSAAAHMWHHVNKEFELSFNV